VRKKQNVVVSCYSVMVVKYLEKNTVMVKRARQDEKSKVCYEALEVWARQKVQKFLQAVLEEEITEFLGLGAL